MFLNASPKLVKTALINFDRVFDAYHKSKIYGFTFEECRANPDKGEDRRAVAIFYTINAVIGLWQEESVRSNFLSQVTKYL